MIWRHRPVGKNGYLNESWKAKTSEGIELNVTYDGLDSSIGGIGTYSAFVRFVNKPTWHKYKHGLSSKWQAITYLVDAFGAKGSKAVQSIASGGTKG